jgi:hypothetical protein
VDFAELNKGTQPRVVLLDFFRRLFSLPAFDLRKTVQNQKKTG